MRASVGRDCGCKVNAESARVPGSLWRQVNSYVPEVSVTNVYGVSWFVVDRSMNLALRSPCAPSGPVKVQVPIDIQLPERVTVSLIS